LSLTDEVIANYIVHSIEELANLLCGGDNYWNSKILSADWPAIIGGQRSAQLNLTIYPVLILELDWIKNLNCYCRQQNWTKVPRIFV